MGDDSTSSERTRLEGLRRHRRQRRAWRRERRKGVMSLYDSTNQAEGDLYRGGSFTKR